MYHPVRSEVKNPKGLRGLFPRMIDGAMCFHQKAVSAGRVIAIQEEEMYSIGLFTSFTPERKWNVLTVLHFSKNFQEYVLYLFISAGFV